MPNSPLANPSPTRTPGERRHRLAAIVAALPASLALVIYALDSDLVNFFLPTRLLVLTALLASVLMLTLLAVRLRRIGRSSSAPFLASGVLVLAAVVVYILEFTAYREVELSFHNDDAELRGTLYLPKEAGRYPTVVIAQGSIRAPRRLYHLFADRLVRSGIAVFNFDKRGTGESGGAYESANNSSLKNLTQLGSDVAAAIRAVRGHEEVEPSRVGILGLSMGGWLAPLAAQQAPDLVDFMVLVSGPTVSVGEEGSV